MLCPCHSNIPYQECCKPFHEGKNYSNSLQLMRSRYSAYALALAEYIIKTTHHKHADAKIPHAERLKKIQDFCSHTNFNDLEIIEFIDGNDQSYVTFRAVLDQDGNDITFTEKSLFKKENDIWKYHSGVML